MLLASSTVFSLSLRSVRKRTFGSLLGRAGTSYTDESLSSSVWAASAGVPTGLWLGAGRSSGNCDAEVSTIYKPDSKQLNWYLPPTRLSLE